MTTSEAIVAGVGGVQALAMLGFFLQINKSMNGLGTRIDGLGTRIDDLNAKVDQLGARLDARLDHVLGLLTAHILDGHKH